MKILELLEVEIKNLSKKFINNDTYNRAKFNSRNDSKPDDGSPKFYDKNKKLQIMGHGKSSAVLKHQNNPDQVIKVSRATKDPNIDAYLIYIQSFINDDQLKNNPYFPKIHQIKYYNDSQATHNYRLKMEKLNSIKIFVG